MDAHTRMCMGPHTHTHTPAVHPHTYTYTQRGRLLAVQSTTLCTVDMAEAARAMMSAVALAPDDTVVTSLASDLELYFARTTREYYESHSPSAVEG